MKTADLIPLILLELNENDKYGLEITKSIESKSNGKIIIKQPTLYTILKKLEKSHFISSYWEDSDIGGKRHYYKITDNGRLQVSTLPSMQELINMIILSEENTEESIINTSTPTAEIKSTEEVELPIEEPITATPEPKSQPTFSIMDMLVEDAPQSVESVLPSEEIFANSSIDTTTESEINQANKDLLKDDSLSKEEAFANNKEVAKFTEKSQITPAPTPSFKDKVTGIEDNLTPKITTQESLNINKKDIKYVDYINIKKDKNYIYANTIAKNMMYKVLSTTGYLIFILAICALATSFLGGSALYYISLIIGVSIIIFYPSIYAFKYQDFKDKIQQEKLNIDMKKRLIIFISIELFILIVTIIVNISIGKGSLIKMFSFNNFANFYAPLLISTALFMDYLFTHIFLFKKKNRK